MVPPNTLPAASSDWNRSRSARDEINALHQMLEDLPEIFERKFQQRQRAFLIITSTFWPTTGRCGNGFTPFRRPRRPFSLARPALPGATQSPRQRMENMIRVVLGLKKSN